MFSHVILGVNDIEASKRFYDALLGALDIAIAAMKLTESNDSGMSGAVDISGADFSVSPLTLPSARSSSTRQAPRSSLLLATLPSNVWLALR